MNDPDPQLEHRQEMVRTQLASRGIRDDRVLEAMTSVPREEFVAPEMVEFAYDDAALPIEANQTISQPYIVAVMLEALELKPEDRVLEVGAGSGYAAATLSRIVAEVFAIERHHSLTDAARRRMERLGMDNVQVRHGDGTLGWEEEAPFDAILVSAGGERVPPALAEQLAPGGRLVMPKGSATGVQDLLAYRKDADGSLSKRSLGAVRFVPLLASKAPAPENGGNDEREHGEEASPAGSRGPAAPARSSRVDLIRKHAEPFDSVSDANLDRATERMSGHRVVLIGEASHGTSEFYALRARLTRSLIEQGEVDFVAVEADWPDAAHLDRYVRGAGRDAAAIAPFARFPRWMWANREVLEFLRWLRGFNEQIDDPEERVGFFGLDLYSLHTSIEAVLVYLDDVDPETADLARDRYGCLNPWERDPQTYGRLVSSGRMESCEDDAVRMLANLLENRIQYERADGFRYMDALENARLVANAEGYYRAIYQGPTASWNLRDQHMFDTLEDLLTYHGPDAGAAVWAHNSHLGDAAATEMGGRGQHNVGQLCRQRFGNACYSVGLGTHTGTVMAASYWGDDGQVMDVRPSTEGSYERLSHDAEREAFFLPMRGRDEISRMLAPELLERAIGVIYRPESERASHYFHASLPRQFDEWVFLDRTRAVSPLDLPSDAEVEGEEVLDTFPFAL